MNTKTRYLVMDRTNTPISPASLGLHLAGAQSSKSPSLLSKEEAVKFLALLASRSPGQNFYLFGSIAAACSHDNIDAHMGDEEKRAQRPVTVVPTTADGAGDE